MKNNRVFIFIILLFVCSVQSFAVGLNDSGTIIAVVSVKSVFQLSMSEGAIDFPSASPGKIADSDTSIVVTSSSTGGNIWHLYVSNDRPLTSGNNIIANKNFSWTGQASGEGEFYGKEPMPLETTPKIVYKSSEKETANYSDGIRNDLKFKLFIPENQPAGSYSCKVIFTMTE